MVRKVSLGVIGLGTIAQTQHLPNIATRSAAFEVVAVADLSARLTEAISSRLPAGVSASPNWRDVIKDRQVDAVMLLTAGAHERMAEEALLAGKHVFAEKPLCLTVEAATRLAKLAKDRNLVLQVGYMKLHEQALDRMEEELAQIGDHRLIRHTVYHPDTESQLADAALLQFHDADPDVLAVAARFEEARTLDALGDVRPEWGRLYRDVLHGSLVHTTSFVRGVMGRLPTITDASIFATDDWRRPGTEPPSLIIGGWLDRTTRVELAWLWLPAYPRYGEVFEVHGTAGSLELALPPPYLPEQTAELKVHTSDRETRFSGDESAFVRELDAFHRSITEDVACADATGAASDVAWLQDLVGVLAEADGVAVGGEAGARP